MASGGRVAIAEVSCRKRLPPPDDEIATEVELEDVEATSADVDGDTATVAGAVASELDDWISLMDIPAKVFAISIGLEMDSVADDPGAVVEEMAANLLGVLCPIIGILCGTTTGISVGSLGSINVVVFLLWSRKKPFPFSPTLVSQPSGRGMFGSANLFINLTSSQLC